MAFQNAKPPFWFKVVRGYKDFHKNIWYKYVFLSLSAFAKKIQKHSPHVNSQTEQIKCMYIYIIMYIIV